MATTLFNFHPHQFLTPSTGGAAKGYRNERAILSFDPTSNEEATVEAVLPNTYNGGGLTVRIFWMSASATTGNVKWDAQIERNQDDAFDVDGADSFATEQTVTDTTASVAGEHSVATITFTAGAQMDNTVAGELFRLRLIRDAADAADTMNSDDAQVMMVEVRET